MHYHQQEIETDHDRRETAVYLRAIHRRFQRIEELKGFPEVFHVPAIARRAFSLGRFADVRMLYRHLLSQHADIVAA